MSLQHSPHAVRCFLVLHAMPSSFSAMPLNLLPKPFSSSGYLLAEANTMDVW